MAFAVASADATELEEWAEELDGISVDMRSGTAPVVLFRGLAYTPFIESLCATTIPTGILRS
jgi:hypothetical protein